jgi:L-lactate dehydrogenase complex protein LldG
MNDEAVVEVMLAEFRLKAEPLGVVVSRVGGTADAVLMLADWLAGVGAGEVIVADDLAERAPGLVAGLGSAGVSVREAASPAETRDAAAGISLAHLAIAETGSMLLSERTLADRSVGMLTLAQAIVCPTGALVPTLDEAVSPLREIALRSGGSFSTLVTGPSRTADIERVLTVGVQGPGVVMNLFVDEL